MRDTTPEMAQNAAAVKTQPKDMQRALRHLRRKQEAASGPGDSIRAILARGPVVRHSGPTGRPKWWGQIERRRLARVHLSRTPLVALDSVSEALGTKFQGYGVSSVYGLSRAALGTLLDIPGVGPATLRKIHAELTRRDIPCKWEVPA